MQANNNENVHKYKYEKSLGNGIFGSVYQCIDKNSNKHVAVKRIPKV